VAQLSAPAARAALAAAVQGHYGSFREQLYAAGPLTTASIALAIDKSGVDKGRLGDADKSGEIAREIKAKLALAHTPGLPGTPSFVIGDQLLSGAVGFDLLEEAVAAERARHRRTLGSSTAN